MTEGIGLVMRDEERYEKGKHTNCLAFIAAAPELPPCAPGPTPLICAVFPKFLVAISSALSCSHSHPGLLSHLHSTGTLPSIPAQHVQVVSVEYTHPSL